MNTSTFNLLEEDISTLIIKETYDKTKCFIWNKNVSVAYTDFILDKNSKTTTICSLNFFFVLQKVIYTYPPDQHLKKLTMIQIYKLQKVIKV